MDYFDSNFNDDRVDQNSELPEDFGWDDMKEGIYNKMHVKRPSGLRKYWPLLLLLLVAGCGTGSWLLMNNFNGNATENTSIALDKDVELDSKPKPKPKSKSKLESKLESKENVETQFDQSTESTSTPIQSSDSKKQMEGIYSPIEKSVDRKNLENSVIETKVNINSNRTSNSNSNSKSNSIASQPKPSVNTNQENQVINQIFEKETTRNEEEWSTLNSIPSLLLDQIANSEFQYKVIDDLIIPVERKVAKRDDEKTDPPFKKYWTMGLAGGLISQSAFDANNINHDHTSAYPGYNINPSIALSLTPKHSIQLDYEYNALEELFDYDGERDIEVQLDNQLVKEVHNSLTGNVISTERETVIANGTRKYREVKYNQYKFHTLSLGYRFDQLKKQRSTFGFYLGASYLLKLNNQGKRLDENRDVVSFDNNNPIFTNNQFGLRLGVHYNYKLSANTSLFSQVMTTKYLTNWEVSSSASSTKPLFYGLQIGLRYQLIK